MTSETASKTTSISPRLGLLLDVVRDADLPVLLRGPHGIGKSEFLDSYAEDRGLKIFVLDLSLLEATDLTGIPYIQDGRTFFAPPSTLPPGAATEPCMLVLEELNRCDRSVRQPCLQLLTTRRLNDYRLPATCFLAACVNPDDAGYEVDSLDPALASRFVTLNVVPDHAAWLLWARENQLFAGLVRFVEKFSQAFERAPPRTWTLAARLIESALQRGWSIPELEDLLNPVLGPMTTRALLMDLPDVLPSVNPKELLASPGLFVERVQTWMKASRLDIVNVVFEQLRQTLLAAVRERQTLTMDVEGFHRILDLVPPDLGVPLLELVERHTKQAKP
ncbi:MAG: AAA family ATPase [Nannocystaceae bacterium]